MTPIVFPVKKNISILALGAESAGVFAVYRNGSIFISKNFGDLLSETNFSKYKKAVLGYFPLRANQLRAGQNEKIKPDVVLSDSHPLYKTTIFAEEIAGKYNIPHIKIQHHVAHVFSCVGDFLLQTNDYRLMTSFFGIVMDGTGYGLDENIWGGEVFQMKNVNIKMKNKKLKSKNEINQKMEIKRIGSLEEQIMIGGDLTVREPARMLVAMLAKITNSKLQITNKTQNTNFKQLQNSKIKKNFIHKFVKKFYTRNEFELLYNQVEQGFNCQTTTSTGRILDAVSVLLGFAGNERKYKHEAVGKLEQNSTVPYSLEPKIISSVIASEAKQSHGDIASQRLLRHSAPRNDTRAVLDTGYLFEYLIKNIKKDKKRLAATAQLYIAKGLYELINLYAISHTPYAIRHKPFAIFAAGGMTNNKIISEYLEKQGVYLAKKIPRGDEGIAVGQIVYFLL